MNSDIPDKGIELSEIMVEELRSRIALLEGELAIRDGLEVLAGGIAHDFNNLLTVILNNVTLMKLETPEGSRTMIGLEEMEKATLKARDLAWKLLNIAGSGSPPPESGSGEDGDSIFDGRAGGVGLESLNGSGRILLVDDEETVRTSTGATLRKLGYAVVLAGTGSEAIEIFCLAADEGRPFDAVILDLTVHGGKGGKETVASLKRVDPEIKAIVSSGYANDEVMTSFREFGFSGKLSKPYTMEDIGKVVKAVLENPASKI